MPTLGLRNTDGATKQIDINGFAVAEATEAGLQMIKTLKALPSAAPADVVVQSQVMGVGQTRQVMTTSRVAGVTYINSTGKPIGVKVIASATAASGFMNLFRGSENVADTYQGISEGAILVVADTYLPDEPYRVEVTNASIVFWEEVR